MKKKWTAFWLCFFLGGIGIHKFYLNRPMLGVLYAIFCWTYVPSIIAFFDMIVLGFMSQEDFDKKYNS